MSRIFLQLTLAAVTLLAVNFVIGLSLGDVRDPAARETQQWATVHRICGMVSAIGVVFVNSLVVTYFVGTSRWCREVVETYKLSGEFLARSQRLKRQTFPWGVLSMLSIVGVSALGGAADPAAALTVEPVWGLPWARIHLAGAMLAMAFIVHVATIQWRNIEAHSALIQEIMAEVRRIRIEKGLAVEQTA